MSFFRCGKVAVLAAAVALGSCTQKTETLSLKDQILQDKNMDKVEQMALDLVKGGFNAGSSYSEVWIRDYNTFIELSMEVMPDSLIRKNLDLFFAFQGPTGDIVDGFVPISTADLDNKGGYKYRLSDLAPDYAAHKNTVETDHETSLVQAVAKYIRKSNNKDYLQHKIGDKTVYERMGWAMEYLINEKTYKKYGLLTGATTADWGDVQHAHPWGVEIDEDTRYCIDIYDNAMFALALNDMIELSENDADKQKWSEVREQILKNTDKYLWDKENRKYIPHVYLTESPFTGFDENKIYYHGGTAVAILAGMLPKEEIVHANNRMLENQKAAHAQTIGLTMYPTYPAGAFESKGMYPYGYQNGGDWTWFGARMIQALIENGMIEEAYTELEPMLTRVIENNSFNEWYTPAGEPMGSGTFRGEAGVLYTAIQMLRDWAENN